MNRYDYVGQLHNRGIDYLVRAAFGSHNSDYQMDVNTILLSFLRENGIVLSEDEKWFDRQTTWVELADTLPDFEEFLRYGNITDKDYRYLSGVLDAIDKLDDELNYCAVQEAIRTLELTIQLDEELTEYSKALSLSVSSVAKHSVEYWVGEAQVNLSAWGNEVSDDTIVVFSKKGVKDVVVKDVKGAGKGFIISSVTSGSPVGGAVGGLVHGVKGSAGGAIKAAVKGAWGKIKGLF